MSTALDIDTTTIEALDFTPGCEHKHHDGDTLRHYGPAEWFQRGTCPTCEDNLNALVCDRWRQTVSTWARTNYMKATCPACHNSFLVAESNLTFTKI